MASRPEGSNRNRPEPPAWEQDPVDDSWQPWRPGDPSPAAHEAPSQMASGSTDGGRSWTSDREAAVRWPSSRGEADDATEAKEPRKPWWTEPTARPYEAGDKVRSTAAVGGGAFSTVQSGTKGQVVRRHTGVLGGEYVDVRFDNGYTETVTSNDIERRAWYD